MRSAPAARASTSSSRVRVRCPTAPSRRSTRSPVRGRIGRFTRKRNAMGFQQGLSGLNASSKSLEVIGNNIANANTVGAKASRAEFADVYANAIGGSNAVGIGVTVADVAQQF